MVRCYPFNSYNCVESGVYIINVYFLLVSSGERKEACFVFNSSQEFTSYMYSRAPKSERVRILDRRLSFGTNLVCTSKKFENRTIAFGYRTKISVRKSNDLRSNVQISDILASLDCFIYIYYFFFIYKTV